jgi:hypothetical protein
VSLSALQGRSSHKTEGRSRFTDVIIEEEEEEEEDDDDGMGDCDAEGETCNRRLLEEYITGYRRSLLWGQSGRCAKVVTHVYLVPNLRMSGIMSPPSYMPLCRA